MHFYPGVDPLAWLERIPPVLTEACVDMMPRLEAEETIARIDATAAATGHVEPDAMGAYSEALERAARGDAAHPPAPDPRRRLPDPSIVPPGQRAYPVRRIPHRPPATVTLTDGV